MNLRAIAALIIYQIAYEGRSLSDCLKTETKKVRNPKDKAFLKALCFGVLRKYYYYDFLANYFLEKPFTNKDKDLNSLLIVGLFQLLEMRVPEHAAVSETVSAAANLKKPWAKSLINAILRRVDKDEISQINTLTKDAYYNHPKWLLDKIKHDWPSDFDKIIKTNNAHPPFSLRVNLAKISRDNYLKKLSENNIKASPISETVSGVQIETPMDVSLVSGFKEGQVSVQDGAAQLAAGLLKLEPHIRVLDACAAPGGKTTHILETCPDLEVIAIDHDCDRLKLVEENLTRLKLKAKLICEDAALIDKWWDGNKFDRILLDAPCSATGIIRRHPDVKLLRRIDDIEKLNVTQKKLLEQTWKLLKSGGLLVYATCSIFPEENVLILKDFLDKHQDAFEVKIKEYWGIDCEVGKQILPGMLGMDGFYYGCLRKL